MSLEKLKQDKNVSIASEKYYKFYDFLNDKGYKDTGDADSIKPFLCYYEEYKQFCKDNNFTID